MQDKDTNSNIDISLVIPVYNEEDSLPELEEAISEALSAQYNYEVIFVDDGSSDNSWKVIKDLALSKEGVKGVSFHHNYGKSVALQAGFENATGEFVVTLDSDLQDDPHEIPEMIQMLKDGYDLVSGWKKVRHDPISKTIPSKFFNYVTRKVAGIDLHDFNCGLKAYRSEVVENIYLYGELHRYIPMLAKREGYGRITEKVVKHHPRKYGKTKFGLSRFMNGFLDLVTITFVQRYLQKPMHFFGTIGMLLLIAGGVINGYMAFIKIFFGESIGNRPLLFLGILLMVVGVQFFSTGLLGELINKNHVEKQKPRIRDRIN
ncbi:glycosyltransferase family 2 protein [Gracilimonas amylolytica]|uniref:glycosyltransferase family 2 protein n=1 Tax=Gracilimonas amylolytica TaxID=1749045 RepID=UPI000CD874F1|nr:glycosyltransferase family 2 protein [Gracilimonas amylolytica]